MKLYRVDDGIHVGTRIRLAAGVLIGAAVIFAIGVALLKLLWVWTVPDLFPAAVAQGLIAAELSWAAAVKAAVLVALLTGTRAMVVGRWGDRFSLH